MIMVKQTLFRTRLVLTEIKDVGRNRLFTFLSNLQTMKIGR